MKNKFLTIAGIAICAIALGLNLQNAFDGYGVKKGTLHPEVLAQTTGGNSTTGGSGSATGGSSTTGGDTSGGDTSGGGSTSGGSSNTKFTKKQDGSCLISRYDNKGNFIESIPGYFISCLPNGKSDYTRGCEALY